MTTTDQDDLNYMPAAAQGERTYGNWQKPPRGGLMNMGAMGTYAAFAAIILGIICGQLFGLWFFVGITLGGLGFTIAFSIKDRDNRSVFDKLFNWAHFRKSKRKGLNIYRGAGMTDPGENSLPGVLGKITVTEWTDAHKQVFTMLSYPQGYHTVVWTGSPDGDSGDDPDDVALKVAYFGEWLASQSSIPGMYAAQFIVETAPESPGRLARAIESARSENSPPLAREVNDQIARDYPEGSDEYRIWVTMTFRERDRIPRLKTRAERIEAMAAGLADDMPELVAMLDHAGAAGLRPVDVQTLCEEIRVAYDPAVAADVEEARAAGASIEAMSWDDAGPMSYQENYTNLVHDSGVSSTYIMTRPPRQLVTAGVLRKLLAPGKTFSRKRVCLHYQVLSDEKASAAAEKIVTDATFAHNASKKKTANLAASVRAAHLTAHEEASGAGMVDFTFGMTVTNLLTDDIENNDRKVKGLGSTAKLKLRLMTGAQAAGFAWTAPLGMQLEEHMTSPKWLSWMEDK